MKHLLLILMSCTILISCTTQSIQNTPIDYECGVIYTTNERRESQLYFYDENLEFVDKRIIKYPELSSLFDPPCYYNNKLYLVPNGLQLKKDEKKAIEIDLSTIEIKEFDVDKINILRIAANDKYIYTISNLNNVESLVQTDKDNKHIKTIDQEDTFFSSIVCVKDKVCLFGLDTIPIGDNEYHVKEVTWLKVYDWNLNLLKKIDLTKIGYDINAFTIHEQYLCFSNSSIILSGDTVIDNDTISILNTDTYELETIQLNHVDPSDVLYYDNKLYVAHILKNSSSGKYISVIDLKDKSVKEYKLDHDMQSMQRRGDKFYILEFSDNNYYLHQYDINFNEVKSRELPMNDLYISVLFVQDYK